MGKSFFVCFSFVLNIRQCFLTCIYGWEDNKSNEWKPIPASCEELSAFLPAPLSLPGNPLSSACAQPYTTDTVVLGFPRQSSACCHATARQAARSNAQLDLYCMYLPVCARPDQLSSLVRGASFKTLHPGLMSCQVADMLCCVLEQWLQHEHAIEHLGQSMAEPNQETRAQSSCSLVVIFIALEQSCSVS